MATQSEGAFGFWICKNWHNFPMIILLTYRERALYNVFEILLA
jgi:hypothetical protein